MKQTWNDLAKARMKEIGMTQERLAELVGKTQGGIGHWLNGRREPSIDDITAIMRALGIPEMSISAKGGVALSGDNFTYAGPYTASKKFPVLSSVQAGAWAEAVEVYTLADVDLWLESDAHIQGEAFWLWVEGDSMTAPVGLSIPEGTYVLFDTGREPVNGSLVIAKMLDSNDVTFKKLVWDGGMKYLKGLNPAWPLTPINGNCKIIGVGVETKMRLV